MDKIENEYVWLRNLAVEEGAKAGEYKDVDPSKIDDSALRGRVEAYINSVKRISNLQIEVKGDKKWTVLEDLVAKTINNEFRLGLGNADVAWDVFDFSLPGHFAFQRRLRDFKHASLAKDKLINILSHFGEYQQKPEAFIQEVKDLFDEMQSYGRPGGIEMAEKLCEGFIRTCDGDWAVKWLPFPLDRIANTFFRNSYAEKVLGEGARSFTAVDKRNLIKHFREMGMFGDRNDPSGHKIEQELFKRLGATRWRVFWEFFAKYGPIGILFFIWQLKEEYEEKVEKAIGG